MVVRDGREWRQPASVSGFTWNELAASCPLDGTACTGQVVNAETSATALVDGWTWARNAEVRELLDSIIQPGTTNFLDDFSNYGGLAEDPDIALAASGGACWFDPTAVANDYRYVEGWSATTTALEWGSLPQVTDGPPGQSDGVLLYLIAARTQRVVQGKPLGAWMFRPLEPATRTLMLLPLPDVNADGVADLAVIRDEPLRAEIRSGGTGALLRTIPYLDSVAGGPFDPVDAQLLPDSDGDGAVEIALLVRRHVDARGVVEIRNVAGPAAPRQVWFAACRKSVALAAIAEDADGNGVPELAVLSIGHRDGRGIVEVKNAYGPTNPTTLWVGSGLTPTDLHVVPDADANGVPEVAVLARRDSDGRIVVELKNASGATNPKAVWFMAGHSAIDLAVVPDADANGIAEVAVLSSRDADGRLVVEVKNAAGVTNANAVWFAAGQHGLAVRSLREADGNGVPEIAVLSSRVSDGRVLVEVKNAAGATGPRSLWYPVGFSPRDLGIFDELDGNAVAEAGVLLVRNADGRLMMEARNASGAQAPRDYWFSP